MAFFKRIQTQKIRAFPAAGVAFVRRVTRHFIEDRCVRVAAALSFTTLLGLVPLTAVAFGMMSIFPVFQSWMGSVQDFIYSNFVPASGDVVQRYLEQFARKAGRLTAFGLLFVVVTAIMVMATVEQAFNDIWRVRARRKFIHRFLTYWAILTLGPLLIGVSLSLTTQLFSAPVFVGQGLLRGARNALVQALPMAFEFAAFLLLYTIVPNARVKWRHALIGAVCAALMFELAKRAFAYYIVQVPVYLTIYGAVAALPIFLVWIYLSWVVILLGAVITANLSAEKRAEE